jgi:hypothetical protein
MMRLEIIWMALQVTSGHSIYHSDDKLRLCALVRSDLTECLHAYPNLSILHVSGPDEFPQNRWMIPSDDRNTGMDNSLYIRGDISLLLFCRQVADLHPCCSKRIEITLVVYRSRLFPAHCALFVYEAGIRQLVHVSGDVVNGFTLEIISASHAVTHR